MAKKVLGIDLGASYYDAVVLEDGKPVAFRSSLASKTTPRKFAESILESCKADEIKATGGRKDLPGLKFGSVPVSYVVELQALAEGARFLSCKDYFLVANVGTGTPVLFVSYSNTTTSPEPASAAEQSQGCQNYCCTPRPNRRKSSPFAALLRLTFRSRT